MAARIVGWAARAWIAIVGLLCFLSVIGLFLQGFAESDGGLFAAVLSGLRVVGAVWNPWNFANLALLLLVCAPGFGLFKLEEWLTERSE